MNMSSFLRSHSLFLRIKINEGVNEQGSKNLRLFAKRCWENFILMLKKDEYGFQTPLLSVEPLDCPYYNLALGRLG